MQTAKDNLDIKPEEKALVEVLTEWKKLLGDEWGQTYALSNSIYVTRQNNILFSILVQFIGPGGH